jgi:hypothetical protein
MTTPGSDVPDPKASANRSRKRAVFVNVVVKIVLGLGCALIGAFFSNIEQVEKAWQNFRDLSSPGPVHPAGTWYGVCKEYVDTATNQDLTTQEITFSDDHRHASMKRPGLNGRELTYSLQDGLLIAHYYASRGTFSGGATYVLKGSAGDSGAFRGYYVAIDPDHVGPYGQGGLVCGPYVLTQDNDVEATKKLYRDWLNQPMIDGGLKLDPSK